jgi:hypothetical protein
MGATSMMSVRMSQLPEQGGPNPVPSLAMDPASEPFPSPWLLPSGLLFVQSNWEPALLNYHTQTETPLDDIPDAVGVYPASAGAIVMSLMPANNWTATILFCGGSNVQSMQ